MALFDNFPFSNMHELNLDWILETVKTVSYQWDEVKQEWEAFRPEITAKVDEIKRIQEEQFELLREDWKTMADRLITSVIPQIITFGLTYDGHFCAYIPEQWKDLYFYTDTRDMKKFPFGRLQLSYEFPFPIEEVFEHERPQRPHRHPEHTTVDGRGLPPAETVSD